MLVSQSMEFSKSSYLTGKRIRFTGDAVVGLVMLEEGVCVCVHTLVKTAEQPQHCYAVCVNTVVENTVMISNSLMLTSTVSWKGDALSDILVCINVSLEKDGLG